jgi:4-amino-4-deoxy-L-arabinose transferase-like glycosyltransferase
VETAEATRAEPTSPSRLGPRLALGAVLVLAGALRLWRLQQNGFDNEYYAAGVRSMMVSWHNFLYNAFDLTPNAGLVPAR